MREPLTAMLRIAVILFCLPFFSFAQDITSNLIGYYPFSGDANDASGNANHGTVFNATLTTDKDGNSNSAYSFNGSSAYIDLLADNSAIDGAGVRTVSAWVNQSNTDHRTIFHMGTTTSCTEYAIMGNGSIQLGSSGGCDISSAFSPQTSSWHHVAVVYTGTNVITYFDGVETDNSARTLNTATTVARLGYWAGQSTYYTGAIDEVRIYDRALSANDVQALTTNSFLVTNNADSGVGSLRWCINNANNTVGSNSITFDPSVDGGTISLLSAITITSGNGNGTSIDGDISANNNPNITVQGGAFNGLIINAANCTVTGLHLQGFTGAPNGAISIDGATATGNYILANRIGSTINGNGLGTANYAGVYIRNGATGNFIGDGTGLNGNVIGNNSFGIYIRDGADANVVSGNNIGIGLDGNSLLGNSRGIDVFSSNDVEIGRVGEFRNLISDNSDGIYLQTALRTVIVNNYLGTDDTGNAAAGTGQGIWIRTNSDDTEIGAANVATRNVIAGNTDHGIQIDDSNGTIVLGNYIGLGLDGDTPLGNNNGILIQGTSTNTTIGDGTTLGRNVISDNSIGVNAGAGVVSIQGNYIGTNALGTLGRGNSNAGINLSGGSGSLGGSVSGQGNVISGNSYGIGVSIGGFSILGNYIGTNASGTAAIPNLNEGIRLGVGSGTAIGDGSLGGANFISGNDADGILAFNASVTGNSITMNYIGLQTDGTSPLGNGANGILIESEANGNTITLNTIANNTNNGIEIGEVAVSGIDNNILSQNYIFDNGGQGILITNGAQSGISPPTITSTLDGLIVGTSVANATIEIFGDALDEGEQYLATTTADGAGDWSHQITVASINSGVSNISATQTSSSNTSEFVSAVLVLSSLYEVINTNDSGVGSLRWAIDNANASLDASVTITFNIGTAGPWVIQPTVANKLPTINNVGSASIIIDATTQPGWIFGDTTTMVHIEGSLAHSSDLGLVVEESNVEIYGLVIDGFFHGIRINTGADGLIIGSPGKGNVIKGLTGWGVISGGVANNITIQSNYIGTSIDGLSPDPNLGSGIGVEGDNILIGGNSVAGEGNVISNNGTGGNEYGIYTGTGDNIEIYGNLIGTDKNGENDFGNLRGIWVLNGASNVTIGGQGTGEGNVISGTFSTYSVRLRSADNIIIDSNIIGLNSAGTTAIPNTGNGIDIDVTTGSGTIIRNNTISASTLDGIIATNHTSDLIIENNYIGTNAAGTAGGGGLGNLGMGIRLDNASGVNAGQPIQIRDNVISGNGSANTDHGIYLEGASSDLIIQGNQIGVESDGTTALGNSGSGIFILDAVSDVLIGGTILAERNIIANSLGSTTTSGFGIYFDDNTGNDDVYAANIDIQQNLFLCNTNVGIGYENNLPIEAPLITSISATDIGGVASVADGSIAYVYESTDACNNDQGFTFLGEATVTGGSWNLAGSFTIPGIFSVFVNSPTEGISPFGSGFLVTSILDNGAGTLREAMTNANMSSTPAVISFELPGDGTGSTWTISLATVLPTISSPLIIDGSTQSTWDMDTDKMVILDGNLLGSGTGISATSNGVEIYGLKITGFPINGIEFSGSGSGGAVGDAFKGNVINDNGSMGIRITGISDVVIRGNRIGTNYAGTSAVPNPIGINLNTGAHSAIIGGSGAGQGNLISGNFIAGISGGLSNAHHFEGNIIGLNISQDAAIPNGDAVSITPSDGSTIVDNIISGNTGVGIELGGSNQVIIANTIGTDLTGTTDFGNGTDGVRALSNDYDNWQIGTGNPGEGNLIAFNSGNAILFTNAAQTGHLISENSIYGNGNGINLNGANNGITAPNITNVTPSAVSVDGIANGDLIEVFVSDGNGQGEAFIGSAVSGGTTLTIGSLSQTILEGDEIVVTRIDGSNNTSEFSSSAALPEIALDFDGTDDFVTIPDDVLFQFGATDFTMEAWFYFDGTDKLSGIVSKRNPVTPFEQFTILINDGTFNGSAGKRLFIEALPDGRSFVGLNPGPNDRFVASPNDLTIGWHHVALVQDYDTELIMYLDGVNVGSSTTTHGGLTFNVTGQPVTFGSFNGNGFFDGEVDEVRIWNTARTLGDIGTNLYASLVGNESGLVAYYDFDQGIPEGNNAGVTTLTDKTANGNDGTLTNMALTGTTSNWVFSEYETPFAPTGLFTTEVSTSQIDLSWTDNALNETGHTIERSDGNNFSFAFLANAAATTYSDNSVTAANGYFYRVVANGIFDSNPSNEKFGSTITPPGNALDFDGVDDYVDIPSEASLQIPTSITLSAWVKRNRLDNRDVILIKGLDWNSASPTNYGMEFNNDVIGETDNKFYFSFDGGLRGVAGVTDLNWHHYAVTAQEGDTNPIIYIDGIQMPIIESAGSATILLDETSTRGLHIGAFVPNNWYSTSTIDEVRIWSTARSQGEIQVDMFRTLTGSESNLEAYYKFDQDETTDVVLPDRSTNNNNGTWTDGGGGVTTPQWLASGALDVSVLNNALDFDGTNDRVIVADNANLDFGTGAFTIEFWLNASSNTPLNNSIGLIAKTATFQNTPGWSIEINTYADPGIQIDITNGPRDGTGGTAWRGLQYDRWYHVAMVRGSSDLKLYIDGIHTNTESNPVVLGDVSNAENLLIGDSWGIEYEGMLDEIRLWNVERTESEIQTNSLRTLVGNEPNLVAYYNFNHGIPGDDNTTPPVNVLVDKSINVLDGALTNFALNGANSNWVSSGSLDPTPNEPLDLFVTEVSDTRIDLDWTDNAWNETDFIIERSDGNNTNFVQVGTSEADAPDYIDNSVTAGNGYFYRVVATDGTNNSNPSNEKFAGTLTPPGNAVSFDGVDDYVAIPDNSNVDFGAGEFTIELWFKPNSLVDGNRVLVSKDLTGQRQFGLQFDRDFTGNNKNLSIIFYRADDSFSGLDSDANAITDLNWHHIAAVRRADDFEIYVDGILIKTGVNILGSVGGAMATSSSDIFLGASNDLLGFVDGEMDEVRIWSASRTQGEIQGDMFSTLVGNEANLEAYYKFDQEETTDLLLPDRSANQNDGVWNGNGGGVTTPQWVVSEIFTPEISVYAGPTNSDPEILHSQPIPANFGNAAQSTTVPMVFAIENTGGSDLTVTNITATGDFSITTSTSFIVSAGSTSNFTVELLASSPGIANGTITILNDDSDESSFVFPVTGTKGAPMAKLWWTDDTSNIDDEIGQSNLDGTDAYTPYYSGTSVDIRGIAVDTTNNMVFWSTTDAQILCGRIGDGNFEAVGNPVVDESTGSSHDWQGLDVDGTAGKVYWCDVENGQVRRVDFDGSNAEVLVSVSGPRDIALDISAGKMYYITRNGGSQQIWRANLDGTSVENLISGLPFLQSLALDLVNGHIYWTDNGGISRANLDGSGMMVISNYPSEMEAGAIELDVANEMIYVIDFFNPFPPIANGGDEPLADEPVPFGYFISSYTFQGDAVDFLQPAQFENPQYLALDTRVSNIGGVTRQDYDALVALYNATDGANWTDNTNWLSANPVSTWFGVTVSGNRVTNIVLNTNNLSGTMPIELGNLTNLIELDFEVNQISGVLPVELGDLSNLTSLQLWGNQLTGSIPTELGNLSSLQKLDLNGNQLSGPIPGEIGNLTQLTQLQLHQNQLTGFIPPELQNLTNLVYLELWTNQLTGSIPFGLGSLTNLTTLWVNSNDLSGNIPIELGNLSNLQYLDLSANQLTGTIPSEIKNLTNLVDLDLSQNQLTGSIPMELESLVLLTNLELDDNQFFNLPDLSALINMLSMEVEDNNFQFDDLEPNAGIAGIVYSPQANIAGQANIDLIEEDALDVTIPVGGSANQYQWVKDGIDVLGQTSGNLLISNVTPTDAGTYHLEITSTLVPGLTISSDPFDVTVLGGNLPPDFSFVFYLDENTEAGERIGTIVATDLEMDPVTYTILSGNTSGAFAVGQATGDITVASMEALDFETTPVFNLEVEANDGNGGIATVSITINLNDIVDENPLGVGDLENQINIYPNPAHQTLYVKSEGILASDLEVQLFTVSGRQVLTPASITLTSDTLMEIDLEILDAGMYLLKIVNDKETIGKNILVK